MENSKLSGEYSVRVYTKVELAMLYNPQLPLTPAVNTLARWIRMNRVLSEALRTVDYNKYRHSFTPREVSLIFQYLGEPGN